MEKIPEVNRCINLLELTKTEKVFMKPQVLHLYGEILLLAEKDSAECFGIIKVVFIDILTNQSIIRFINT